MNLDLTPSFQHLPRPVNEWRTWYVGYSGGLDSTVLLHMLWQQGLSVHAVHVNHQLQPLASQWAVQCAKQCQLWNIPFTLKTLTITKNTGESLEAAARHARYQAFKEVMQADSLVCTAHHQDDQAETLLLQALRGCGVQGLAAMPMLSAFDNGILFRPLLNFTRVELVQYAQRHQLQWIDDPTNADDNFDRNYLRQHIFPLLKQRWPAAAQTLARSAEHCAEAADLLHDQAVHDYQSICNDRTLLISKLNQLSPARQRQVIRYWLAQLALPLPSTAQLQQIQQEVINSRDDAEPLVHWPGVDIHRYRDRLYANKNQETLDLTQVILSWDFTQPLKLPSNLGILTAQLVKGQGIRASCLTEGPITIQFRRGGERCHPSTRAHSQTLKNLCQEYAIPPWQRNSTPLLYCGNKIIAVIGHWIEAGYQSAKHEIGYVTTHC